MGKHVCDVSGAEFETKEDVNNVNYIKAVLHFDMMMNALRDINPVVFDMTMKGFVFVNKD